MQISGLHKRLGLALLVILVTVVHFWLMSIDFYQAHRSWLERLNTNKSRSTITASWASSSNQSNNLGNPSANSSAKPTETNPQTQSVRQTRSSIFAMGSNSSPASAEDPFISSQKLREQTLRNAQVARAASTQTALKDLQDILFHINTTAKSGQKKCCVVAAIQSQASCNLPELTMYYQNIFDSLRSRLNELAREGIKEFCEN